MNSNQGKTERELLIEEFIQWLNAMEDDEQLKERMQRPEFLAQVSEENLRILIASKKELYRAHKDLDDLFHHKSSDTPQ